MILRFVFLLLFFSLTTIVFCQDNYLITFTNKKGVSFDPYTYFDKKAIDRRIKLGISLYDETDFPLNEYYVAEVASLVSGIDIELRWFNSLSVYATTEQICYHKKPSICERSDVIEQII